MCTGVDPYAVLGPEERLVGSLKVECHRAIFAWLDATVPSLPSWMLQCHLCLHHHHQHSEWLARYGVHVKILF